MLEPKLTLNYSFNHGAELLILWIFSEAYKFHPASHIPQPCHTHARTLLHTSPAHSSEEVQHILLCPPDLSPCPSQGSCSYTHWLYLKAPGRWSAVCVCMCVCVYTLSHFILSGKEAKKTSSKSCRPEGMRWELGAWREETGREALYIQLV